MRCILCGNNFVDSDALAKHVNGDHMGPLRERIKELEAALRTSEEEAYARGFTAGYAIGIAPPPWEKK